MAARDYCIGASASRLAARLCGASERRASPGLPVLAKRSFALCARPAGGRPWYEVLRTGNTRTGLARPLRSLSLPLAQPQQAPTLTSWRRDRCKCRSRPLASNLICPVFVFCCRPAQPSVLFFVCSFLQTAFPLSGCIPGPLWLDSFSKVPPAPPLQHQSVALLQAATPVSARAGTPSNCPEKWSWAYFYSSTILASCALNPGSCTVGLALPCRCIHRLVGGPARNTYILDARDRHT